MPRRTANLKESIKIKSKKADSGIKVSTTKLSRLGVKVKKADSSKAKGPEFKAKVAKAKATDSVRQPTKTAFKPVDDQQLVNNQAVEEQNAARGKIIRQASYQTEDRQKKLIMWTGVAFFMILFVGFWLFNLKTIFKVDNHNNANSSLGLEEITNNLAKTMDEVSKSMDKLNNPASSTSSSTVGTAEATSSPVVASSSPLMFSSSTENAALSASSSSAVNANQTELEVLRAKLEALQQQIGTSTKASLPND